jgi:outer membrane protein OmpA-like peptidoglycan-associated protein
MNRSVIAISAIAFVVAGCTSNPFTGEQQVSNTAVGAGTGAALGAVTGALLGATTSVKTRKAALIGAGIGALAGGGVGVYMDNQEAQLRKRLASSGVSVTRVGDTIVLNMPSNVTFDSDEANIKSQFYDTLNAVAVVFQEYNKTLIDIVGHTDASGEDDYNYGLSRRRASSVAQYMVSQQLNPERFQVEGRGESQPVASNESEAGKSQNRRVEITIQPLT